MLAPPMNTHRECLTLLLKWLECFHKNHWTTGDPYAEQVLVATSRIRLLVDEAEAIAREIMGDHEAYEAFSQPQLPFAEHLDEEPLGAVPD